MERGKNLGVGGLIVFLVDKVAISGKAGLLQHEINRHIQDYYSQTPQNPQTANGETSQFWLPSTSPPTLDEPFFDYIWRTLIRHPEIHSKGQNQSSETTGGKEVAPDSVEAGPTQTDPGSLEGNDAGKERVFASETQIWRAIAGHEPDWTRVPNLDFICLSIIAASGPKGIIQNDLVRISGQDKRSLPNRTDRLHKSGYIKKQPVELVLHDAIVHTSLLFHQRFAEVAEAIAATLTEDARQRQSGKKSQKKRAKARNDLAAKNESLDKQEASGLNRSTEDDSSNGISASRPVVQWTPNRNLLNQIFETVDRSGTEGATQIDVNAILMGSEYKKPIDELLAKLATSWQISQPLHLRHLAIVRDCVQRNRSSVYIYYTYENYKKLVEAGKKTWEAIFSLQDKKIVGESSVADIEKEPAVDEYGFPELDPTLFQGQDNDGSLRECVPRDGSGSAAAKNFKRSPRKDILGLANDLPATPKPIPAAPKPIPATPKPRGRPRKNKTIEKSANVQTQDVEPVEILREKSPRDETGSRTVSNQENESLVVSSDGMRPAGMQSVGTRKRHVPKSFDDSLDLTNSVSKKPRVKNPEISRTHATPYWQLPSVAAHSHLCYPFPAVDVQPSLRNNKQKRVRSLDAADDVAERIQETPSKRAKITSSRENIIDATPIDSSQHRSASQELEDSRQSSPPSPKLSSALLHGLMAEKYAKTIDSMPHPEQGVSISKVGQRNKRRGDPAAVTTMIYQMAIFKLPALRNLDWFVDDRDMSGLGESSSLRRPEQSNTSQANTDISRHHSSQEVGAESSLGLSGSPAKEAETNTSQNTTSAETATPKATRPKKRLRIQSPEFVVLSEQRDNTPSASARVPIHRANGSHDVPSHNITEDTDDSESVSILPIVAPASETEHDLNQSGAKPPNSRTSDQGMSNGLVQSSSSMPRKRVSAKRKLDFIDDELEPPAERDPSLSQMNFNDIREYDMRLPDTDYEVATHLRADNAKTASSNQTRSLVSLGKSPDRRKPLMDVFSPSPRKARNKTSGVTGRKGGSTAIMRREVILDLIGRCGGVFPGSRAMRLPFEHEWKARGQIGVPDKITINKSMLLCSEQGSLRRLIFSFKDRDGISATATIFALPEIEDGDSKIVELQEIIRQHHPKTFVPDAVMPKITKKPPDPEKLARAAAEKKAIVDKAKGMASKSQEERAEFISSLEASGRSDRQKKALSRLANPSAPRVQRLESVRKPLKRFISMQVPGVGHALNSRYEKPGEEQSLRVKQTSIQAGQNSQTIRRVKDKFAIIEGKSAGISPLAQGEGSGQTSAEPVLDKRRQTQPAASRIKKTVEDTLYTMPAFMDPIHSYHRPSGTFSTSFSGFRVGALGNRGQIQPAASRIRKTVEDTIYTMPAFMDPIHSYHRPSGTFFTSFSGFRVGAFQSNHRGKRRYTHKSAIAVGYQSPFYVPPTPTVRFPGKLGPGVFHSPSGTFSVEFSGFQQVNLQNASVKHPPKRRGRPPGKKQDVQNNESHPWVSPSDIDQDDSETNEMQGRTKAKRRHKNPIADRKAFDDEEENSKLPLAADLHRVRRVRGPQISQPLGADDALRLFVAVTVIRVLCGGTKRSIDWALVAKVFEPEHDQVSIQSKWSSVLSRLRHHQLKMDADFQALFLRAYEQGTVPPIDFDELDTYDWKWLVEWTMQHLGTPVNSAPHLLADRSAFDLRYTLKDESQEKNLAHYFELEGHSVQELRYSVINRQAYSCPLFPKSSSGQNDSFKEPQYDGEVSIARSWIRANINTPAESYDSRRARAKLTLLPTQAIETALESLLRDKLIVEKYKSRSLPEREYDMSDLFEKRLRGNMPLTQFHRAYAFKSALDQAFERDGKFRWSPVAHDGEVMAIMNLVAHHRITIVPIDPPLNKWGHTDDGYATRQMDKSRLNFEMDLVPTPTYITGKPLEPLPPPPASHINPADGGLRKIPLWFDINDNVVPVLWKHTLAAVLGLLAIKTGAGAAEIQVTLRPSVEVWEVEEVLRWCVGAGVAEVVGTGFALREWWWMGLG